jgi:uncharacterized protein DUF6600
MKRRVGLFALLVAVATSGCAATYEDRGYEPPPRHAYASASVGFFYDELSPYGTWVDVAPYGWVWCPLDASYGWRPYTVGYWVYGDYGWMWMSDDPWGWIPYHYGRWTFDSYYGWCWVPGDVWAPAWVAWRYGPGWVGWAPLPPDVGWRVGVGISYSSYDFDRRIHRYDWCFSRASDFGTERIRVRVEPPSKNVTLLRVTRNVTRYRAVGSTPAERGLLPDMIERDTRKPIARYHITDSSTPLRDKGAVIRGQTVEIYRPQGKITEVVRERVRSTPQAERSLPSQKLMERQDAQRREMQDRVQRERDQLRDEQQRELRERPPGVSERQIQRRQQEEMRAQREVEDRQRQAMEQREQRLRGQAQRREQQDEKQRQQSERQRDRGERGRGR